MPAGPYDQDRTYTNQQNYTPNHSYNANESAASILKTVKAQVQISHLLSSPHPNS